MKIFSFIFVFLTLIFLVASVDLYDGLKNKRVERIIDLTTQFSRQKIEIEVENQRSNSVKQIFLTIHSSLAEKLSYIEVVEEKKGIPLEIKSEGKLEHGNQSYNLYSVLLEKQLVPQSSIILKVVNVFSHSMIPSPASVAQDERQLVKYFDNHFFSSPYPTDTQTTEVKLASSHIESKSEQYPTSVKDSIVTYGPYEDIKAFSYSQLSIHFENNKPFISGTLVKQIEISHWGANVAVEETYELVHTGAKLKGTFSRFDYQRTPPGKSGVIPILKQTLPLYATDVYYRDEIGNISTSHLFETDDGPTMDVIPRFPLFGGWKIGFYFGYNLPSYAYLFTDSSSSNTYVLEVNFASCFPNVSVDELTVKIIFPEGVRNIQSNVPFPIDAQSSGVHFTYLDTVGRPVLILKKKNVVPEHNQKFQVTYTFSSISLLQEPFLLIGAYFLFFVLFMVYERISVNIGPIKKEDN
jgi:oligosaccharyltransferase complex subunit alpha (ribophorin I)